MKKFDELPQSGFLAQIRAAMAKSRGRHDEAHKEFWYWEAKRLTREAESAWARLNGLKRRPSGFSVSALIPGRIARHDEYHPRDPKYFDHMAFFSAPYGRWRAIVAHLYGPDAAEHARKFAAQHGLVALIPPNPTASWYYPDECTMIVYTAPGTSIEWLPEQMRHCASAGPDPALAEPDALCGVQHLH